MRPLRLLVRALPVTTLAEIGGLSCIVAGLALWSVPVAMVVGGMLLVALAVVIDGAGLGRCIEAEVGSSREVVALDVGGIRRAEPDQVAGHLALVERLHVAAVIDQCVVCHVRIPSDGNRRAHGLAWAR